MAHNKHFIYQINTWVWLTSLSKRYGRTITLNDVPDRALDEIARHGLDMIWLMGVWKRSAAGRANSLKYKHEYLPVLPDLTDADVIGSAYSIADYSVDERLGGRAGLAKLRKRLKQRGLTLMLDFVPNHVGLDHPWLEAHPDYLVRGSAADLKNRKDDFFRYKPAQGKSIIYAHGRDPMFPGWSDTTQLNVFNPDLRQATIQTLLDIASQCDGVRCDMAMLLLNDIFANTWRGYVGEAPPLDFWKEIIPPIKAKYPNFTFVAEVYWNKEYEILQQGFDYAYDKILYDRIMEGDVQKLRQHLLADLSYQDHMLRFIENHDEPRAYARLGAARSLAAATLICTLPGAVLLHDGQLTGRSVKLPVQIKRQPDEESHDELEDYYMRLLREVRDPIYQQGDWYLFEMRPIAEGNYTHQNLLAYGWYEQGKDYRLIVINLTPHSSQGRVNLSAWPWLEGAEWQLYDVTDDEEYERAGAVMTKEGLTILLGAYEAHVFRFEAVAASESIAAD
ncbi:MAG TPA: alpha-amylase family glycosyl hydrolase [Phototrophicaceae bacterium]|nr:alpha-amylase family glycosyl hydrolase [Phototrophicaceae bacterium]